MLEAALSETPIETSSEAAEGSTNGENEQRSARSRRGRQRGRQRATERHADLAKDEIVVGEDTQLELISDSDDTLPAADFVAPSPAKSIQTDAGEVAVTPDPNVASQAPTQEATVVNRPAPRAAAIAAVAPAAKPAAPLRFVGRSANDPRQNPHPVSEVEIVTESLVIDPSSFPPVQLPQPTRPQPPRAANDPRHNRAGSEAPVLIEGNAARESDPEQA